MRSTGNIKGASLELLIVKACQAALLFIILVIPASAQTPQKPTEQRPTATRPRPQVEPTFANKIKVCLDRPADAVMTAQNTNGDYSGQVDSTRAAYAYDANDCEYFMVDVILPEGFKVSGQHTINRITISGQFSSMTAFTENTCPQASFRTIIYKSYPNSTEKLKVHDINHRGVWLSGGSGGFNLCDFFTEGKKPLEVDIPEGGVGIKTTYRVLVLPKLNGQPRRAKVKWGAIVVPS